MPATKHDLLGLPEVAALLGVQVATTHVWRTRGVLPPPDHVVSNGQVPIWERATIVRWAQATGRWPDGV